jgi:hypothetical protein
VVAFARDLVEERGGEDRLARVTTVFTFVAQLVNAGPAVSAPDALRPLQPLLAFREGPAVLLCALLKALGERSRLERTREMTFVCVALEAEDVARLPPHARLLCDSLASGGRLEIPLDPREARTPLGFLPRAVRDVLRRRAAAAAR